MTIKPVLVPDHDAVSLRRLMDHFATASTGPTKRQLNESRAAVAAAQQNLSEGIMDVVKQTFNDCVAGYPQGTSEGQFLQGWARAIRAETGRDISAEKLTKLYHDYARRSPEIMQSHGTQDEGVSEGNLNEFLAQGVSEGKWNYPPEYTKKANADDEAELGVSLINKDARKAWRKKQKAKAHKELVTGKKKEPGVTEGEGMSRAAKGYEKYGREGMQALAKAGREGRDLDPVRQRYDKYDEAVAEAGRPDVMRHQGDTTVKVVKRRGVPIGEIGIDAEASEGNGSYYVKLYDGSYDAVGFDTAEEALAELKYAISEGLAEVLGTSPDRLMARTGMNLPHKFPRTGQTNLGNIPGTNLPDSSEQTKKYGQERRANRPDNLKAAIRDQLGKHNRPDLPESGVTEARNNVSVPAALEMLKDARAYLDQFDPEDDDDYFDAYETIAAEFDMESNDSSNDPLTDLLDMYEVNPQQAAQMLADHLQSQSKDVTETADGVKYGVFRKGGSIGSDNTQPLKTFDTKEEAVADARRRRSGLSKGERGYYGMGYVVKPIRGVTEDDVDDFVAGGGKITQVKPNPGPRHPGLSLGSRHIGGSGDGTRASRTGRGSKPQGKPVVAVEQQVDEIDMGLVGDAVAGAAMGLGSVGVGSYIGHKIGNKIGQKFIDRSNRKEAERQAKYDREEWRSHRSEIDEKSEAVSHGNNSRSRYPVDESIDPVEQLRADIKRFSR